MSEDKIAQLVPTKSDKERALEHKANIVASSQAFLDALTKADADGFKAQVNFGPDAFGKIVITHLLIMKQF